VSEKAEVPVAKHSLRRAKNELFSSTTVLMRHTDLMKINFSLH